MARTLQLPSLPQVQKLRIPGWEMPQAPARPATVSVPEVATPEQLKEHRHTDPRFILEHTPGEVKPAELLEILALFRKTAMHLLETQKEGKLAAALMEVYPQLDEEMQGAVTTALASGV